MAPPIAALRMVVFPSEEEEDWSERVVGMTCTDCDKDGGQRISEKRRKLELLTVPRTPFEVNTMVDVIVV